MSTDAIDPAYLVESLSNLLIGDRPLTPPQDNWIPLHEFSCFHHGGSLPVRSQDVGTEQPWPPHYINHNCHHCDVLLYLDQLAQVYTTSVLLFQGAVHKCEKLKSDDPLRRSVLIRNALSWEFNEIREVCVEQIQRMERSWVERWGPGNEYGLAGAFLSEARDLGLEYYDA